MGVNKVDFCGKTLIDLSSDTIVPEKMLEGTTAHAADGEPIVGTMSASSGGGPIESPLVVPFYVNGGFSTLDVNVRIPLAISKPNKVIIKNLSMFGTTTGKSQTIYFSISGKKKSNPSSSTNKNYYYLFLSKTKSTKSVSEEELDISDFDSLENLIIYKSSVSGTVLVTDFTVSGSLELYF